MEQNLDAQQIVSKAAEIMFAQTDRYTPVLQAIQSAIGITVDGDLLVIGFEPKDNQLAGHLTASINRNLIAQAIQEAAGRQLNFRVIEGTTLDDWTRIKQAEERLRQRAEKRAEAAPPDQALEKILEEMAKEKEAAPAEVVAPEKIEEYAAQAQELLTKTGEIMLGQSDRFSPALQAWAAATGIMIDGDTLVVGFATASHHLAGHLETPANRNLVLKSLEEAADRKMDFRVIEGTTWRDWQRVKVMEAQLREEVLADAEKRVTAEAAEQVWDRLAERMHHAHQQLRHRQFPQARVQYLLEVLPWLLEAEEQAKSTPGSTPEGIERALARAIDRLATLSELNPTHVALELLRLRERPGKSGGQ